MVAIGNANRILSYLEEASRGASGEGKGKAWVEGSEEVTRTVASKK